MRIEPTGLLASSGILNKNRRLNTAVRGSIDGENQFLIRMIGRSIPDSQQISLCGAVDPDPESFGGFIEKPSRRALANRALRFLFA